MLQYQPTDMIGKAVVNYMHPNDAKAMNFLIRAMQQGGDEGRDISSTGTFKMPKTNKKLADR
jgi:hypothetical protein